jgi:glycosyltransferase involved in cell wall biosynthesis
MVEENKKIKVLTISDHPFSPSGVGTQTKYVIESLLNTGKFQIVAIAGAMKHDNYNPQKTEEWGDDLLIFPVDGYGDPEAIRSIIRNQKPDILWFMTDPRFYEWLWGMENEIRPLIPMVYYHVWDNLPAPHFNEKFYSSNDFIGTISKVTDNIVKTVSPNVDSEYIPHAVDNEIFKKLDDDGIEKAREKIFQDNLLDEDDEEKMVFFWNNRNARRKQSGCLIWWFKEFLDKVGHDKAILMMHTDPKDSHGQDLEVIAKELNFLNGEVVFSTQKLDPPHLAKLYNAVDCTINISDAEGFGLATLESLSCGTPIIVNMTGGLQEQVTDGENWFGIGIEPCSKSVIGSQQVPYIYEDRIHKEHFLDAIEKMYEAWKNDTDEYKQWAEKGMEHVKGNYGFENYQKKWVEIMENIYEKHGSWDTRQGYKSWELREVA